MPRQFGVADEKETAKLEKICITTSNKVGESEIPLSISNFDGVLVVILYQQVTQSSFCAGGSHGDPRSTKSEPISPII